MDQNDDNPECQDLIDKAKQCTRNMAHNVKETYSSPKVQSWMALAKGGLCAFVLLPLINLLTLLIANTELYWGYRYKNPSVQCHGVYLIAAWGYVSSIAFFHFYIPQPSNRFSPKITYRFRVGYALVVAVGATIIFATFCNFNFLDRAIKSGLNINQELLLMAGFVINLVNIVVMYTMRPDEGPWGELICPPFEFKAYRHLKCCSFGAVISMLVYELDQTYGYESRRDILLLSYYFWAIAYCAYSDVNKIYNMAIYRRPRVMTVIRSSNNV